MYNYNDNNPFNPYSEQEELAMQETNPFAPVEDEDEAERKRRKQQQDAQAMFMSTMNGAGADIGPGGMPSEDSGIDWGALLLGGLF